MNWLVGCSEITSGVGDGVRGVGAEVGRGTGAVGAGVGSGAGSEVRTQ